MHRVSSACFALALASALAGCRSKVESPDTGPGRPSVVRAAGPANGHAAAPVVASAAAVADQLPKDGLSLTTGLSWDAAGVALSADGKLLVTAGGYFAKPELKVWPLPVGKAARELPGQSGPVLAVSFAPASTVLAAGDFDGNVLVRDLDSGKELFARKASPGQVRSVALAAAGKTLATGGGWLDFGSQKAFGEVKVWDTAGGGPRHFKGHDGLVLGVALTADGKLLASASSDKTVRLWDVAAGKELKKMEGHTADVNSVALSADGKLLASGGKDKLVIVWDVSSGKPAHTLKGHTGEVTSVALSADGKLLASGGKDKTVRLWDTAAGKEVATVKAPDEVLGVALTPDGKVLAAGGRGKSAKVWSVAAVRK
jgi:WD40 repeat protein